MVRPGLLAALKAMPAGTRGIQSPGLSRISPMASEMYSRSSFANAYGPFLPRPARTFTDGAFAPMSPIQPVPVDQPQPGAEYVDPRLWQYTVGWNLPTPPGSEGLKLASFDQLRVLSQKYSVARACIELRRDEIRGLEWDVNLTTEAAKAYRGSVSLMRDFGERKAAAVRFFKRPDPDFWNFDSFLSALLEEIFVYDALALIFQPKFGERLGMTGRGLFGSSLDCLQLVSGPTIRPLIGLHGEHPRPPAPAYQQYLYGVPRSDYVTIARDEDIDEYALAGSEVNQWDKDLMLYAPLWPTRESPYGFPPVERALIPIISGLQKQEFQLDYFTEGTVPAVYISPGDNNITPVQIKELQDALNGIAGDPAYHQKVLVLPPGSKVEPQRPVDLSDSFDFLVMNQVCMAFDVQPMELGILPNIGGTQQGPSASAVRFSAQENRDIKSRKSTKPLLLFIQDIFNYVLQELCGQTDLRFEFEGMVDDEDKAAITSLGVEQVQNGISSIDEIRERLDMAPWGLQETSEPVVFTQQGPIPFSMAPELIQAALNQQNNQGNGSSSSSGGKKKKTTSKQPSVKRGTSTTKPNGTHSAPAAPGRANPASTPGIAAAAGQLQRPQRGKTGGTPGRSQVAGSRKRGEGLAPTQGRLRNKAAESELDALRRHLRKNREAVYNWRPEHITTMLLAKIADDLARGTLIDVVIDKAKDTTAFTEQHSWVIDPPGQRVRTKAVQWPGWQHDLNLVKDYSEEISDAFRRSSEQGEKIRKQVGRGEIYVPVAIMHDMIHESAKQLFSEALTPMWADAWDLGYRSAAELLGKQGSVNNQAREAFMATQGQHWMEEIALTGLGNSNSRSDIIARTEVARAQNAAALQCYKDNGVSYKRLLVSPDDTCKVCKKASKDGVIPLDAPFSVGGLSGPLHPQCRCIPGPATIDVTPPLAGIKKSDDPNKVSFLLIRARDPENSKWHYLLQKRSDDGTWSLPGGTHHKGEDAWHAALRETQEEIGEIPPVSPKVTLQHRRDDKLVHIFLVEAPFFHPSLDGETQEETLDTGWFRKKEVSELNLSKHFRDQWEAIDWNDVGKRLRVDPNGTITEAEDDGEAYPASGGGARWPYPKRPDGTEDPDGTGEEVPGDWGRHGPPSMWPYPQQGDPGPGATQVGSGVSKTGVIPVTGSVPAKAPQPMDPHSTPPEEVQPGDTVEHWDAEQGQNVVTDLQLPSLVKPSLSQGGSRKGPSEEAALADPKKPGGASDFNDPNPVEAEHVYLQMAKNFPPEAIEWIRRAKWIGPIWVPWNRVDTDDKESWAASHQPEKVKEFEDQIRAHAGHVAPSVMVQEPNNNKAFIVDGHHRAVARENLKQDVLAYVGNIDPRDRQAALETHSKQIHSGASPENKAASPKG